MTPPSQKSKGIPWGKGVEPQGLMMRIPTFYSSVLLEHCYDMLHYVTAFGAAWLNGYHQNIIISGLYGWVGCLVYGR